MEERQNIRRGDFEPPKQMPHRLFTLKRNGPNKIYRLKGYTSKAAVDEKWKAQRRVRFIQRLLVFLLFVLLIVLLFYWIDPIPKIQELIRVLGGGE